MPRHRNLNLKKFLDSIPEAMIEEYFKKRLKKRRKVPLKSFHYNAVNEFLDNFQDEELKNTILEEFTQINDLCERTMSFLIRATRLFGIEITGEEERQALAMDLFLHHREAFDYAYDYYCLFNASAKMSQHNVTATKFRVTKTRINAFKERLVEFYSKSAKGSECIVRHYDEEDQLVVVVIRGSYKRSVAVWKGKKLETIFFRPAHEDILQFNKSTSVLSIKAPYKKDKNNYIQAFTESILKDRSQAERLDRDVTYTLEPLRKGTFSFAGNEIISSLSLLEVKLAMRGLTNPAVTIRSSDVLKTLEDDLNGIRLDSGELVCAKLRFNLQLNGKVKKVIVEINPPNVTDLVKKKHAEIIGDYLKEQGVKLV